MKKKIAGLMLLVVLMAVIGGIYFVTGNAPQIDHRQERNLKGISRDGAAS